MTDREGEVIRLTTVALMLGLVACDTTSPPRVVATYELSRCIAAFSDGDTVTVSCRELVASQVVFHEGGTGVWTNETEDPDGAVHASATPITYAWSPGSILLVTPVPFGSGASSTIGLTKPFYRVSETDLLAEFTPQLQPVEEDRASSMYTGVVYARVSGEL